MWYNKQAANDRCDVANIKCTSDLNVLWKLKWQHFSKCMKRQEESWPSNYWSSSSCWSTQSNNMMTQLVWRPYPWSMCNFVLEGHALKGKEKKNLCSNFAKLRNLDVCFSNGRIATAVSGSAPTHQDQTLGCLWRAWAQQRRQIYK